jgi:translation elongation factor EF-Tu-like GTPase
MGGFRFRVEKSFSIPGRGVVVSGKVEEGKVAVEQVIGFLEATGQWKNVMVVAIEVEHRLVEEAEAGQQASLLLDGVKKNQIAIGTILLDPPQGSVSKEAYQPESVSEPAFPARTPAGPRILPLARSLPGGPFNLPPAPGASRS